MPPCAPSSWSWSGGNAAAKRGYLGDPAWHDFGKMDLFRRGSCCFCYCTWTIVALIRRIVVQSLDSPFA